MIRLLFYHYINIFRIVVYASLESFIWNTKMGDYQHEFYIEILYIKFILPLSYTLKSGMVSKIMAVIPAIQTEVKS